ncbi:MAG: hypothetical protein LBG60_05180 [Bifidobacteriaceae bacterium]|nr:hypothetical protein [Bifidobacteriaceae bacterium]
MIVVGGLTACGAGLAAEQSLEESVDVALTAPMSDPGAASCLEFDDSGAALAYGEFSDAAIQMGDKIAEIVSLRSAEVAGSAYCSDRQGLVVFIKPGSDEAEQDLLAVAALYPDQTLEFQYVPRSADEMDDLVAEVVAVGLPELGLSGIGPDVTSGGLLVEARGYGDKADAPADELIAEAEAAVIAIVGSDVPLDTDVSRSEMVAAYNR